MGNTENARTILSEFTRHHQILCSKAECGGDQFSYSFEEVTRKQNS